MRRLSSSRQTELRHHQESIPLSNQGSVLCYLHPESIRRVKILSVLCSFSLSSINRSVLSQPLAQQVNNISGDPIAIEVEHSRSHITDLWWIRSKTTIIWGISSSHWDTCKPQKRVHRYSVFVVIHESWLRVSAARLRLCTMPETRDSKRCVSEDW